jgi:GTPase SAR1 family protein
MSLWLLMTVLVTQGVGKSHLFSIATERVVPPQFVPTIGVDFANRLFVHPSLPQPFNVQFWVRLSSDASLGQGVGAQGHSSRTFLTCRPLVQDTAGQERFRSIVSSFFRYVSVSALVYNVASTESLASIRDHWSTTVRRVNSNADQLRVILGTCVLSHASSCAALLTRGQRALTVGIEDAPGTGQRRPRAVSEEEGRAVAREIGALWWMEIPLGRASTGEAVERLVSGLVLGSSQLDPFAPLRNVVASADGGGNADGTPTTTWHVPSAELCDALFSRSMQKDGPKQAIERKEDNVRPCVLQ